MKLLDLTKVAESLDCSYEHVRTLCAKGKLVFVNIGTGSKIVYRVRQDDLDQYLADRRRAAGRAELENVRTTLAAFSSVGGRW